ncbi:MAG: hypothetical protein U0T33_11190 [Bacteroidales bacterium]
MSRQAVAEKSLPGCEHEEKPGELPCIMNIGDMVASSIDSVVIPANVSVKVYDSMTNHDAGCLRQTDTGADQPYKECY